MMSLHNLPEDVLEEIFLRVPPKSLKSSSSVVTIHDRDCSNDGHLPSDIEEINFPPVPETEKADFLANLLSSSCNRIIFFCDRHSVENEVFVVCNPELGEYKLLRTPCLSPFEFSFSGAGFGYDPKANDYKCVKLFCSMSHVEVNRATIYCFGTDSWREVKIDLKGKCCYVDNGVYHRGVYYWWNIVTPHKDYGAMVLSFDFSEEEFHCIQLPQHAEKVWKLALWNESVVFFISPENSYHSTSFEMWVMVENFGGVEGFTYWTKHLTIGPLVCVYSPLAFWKDDVLLMQTRDGRIVSYNLRTKTSRELPTHGSVLLRTVDAFLYPKSLVSLRSGHMINH
ncbi:F-box/kelch-repeat protein At3g06240-like [Morus notabilis]|uniref:F-box/kelch-repeat protein At3g06240-like n=1 Tax=Morus notabilis TaxID=981085 RepID=UPI000CED3E5A|nr:F-box/kelch-repeat protein At3g06240-like [Morus notabilis]